MRAAAACVGLLLSGCTIRHQKIHPVATEPGPEAMAEFWKEPDDLATRDLFWGPWGEEHAPTASGRFEFRSRKSTGFSRGFDVEDEKGVKWSAKVGDEAQSEVVASRLMWAMGYHQPPVYYLPHWTLSGQTGWAGPQGPARFRAHLKALDDEGDWDWHRAPFTGTQPWRGALVMMLLLNNSDLKPSQNNVYELKEPRQGVRRWYVVRDLGLSLGESGARFPKRNDIDKFEQEPFIVKQEGGRLHFGYSGRWKELFTDLTPADIRWTCERLNRLSPRQWEDAFRAAGYAPDVAARFIRRFQQKIEQGLALQG
jgi:hypothetical protein